MTIIINISLMIALYRRNSLVLFIRWFHRDWNEAEKKPDMTKWKVLHRKVCLIWKFGLITLSLSSSFDSSLAFFFRLALKISAYSLGVFRFGLRSEYLKKTQNKDTHNSCNEWKITPANYKLLHKAKLLSTTNAARGYIFISQLFVAFLYSYFTACIFFLCLEFGYATLVLFTARNVQLKLLVTAEIAQCSLCATLSKRRVPLMCNEIIVLKRITAIKSACSTKQVIKHLLRNEPTFK